MIQNPGYVINYDVVRMGMYTIIAHFKTLFSRTKTPDFFTFLHLNFFTLTKFRQFRWVTNFSVPACRDVCYGIAPSHVCRASLPCSPVLTGWSFSVERMVLASEWQGPGTDPVDQRVGRYKLETTMSWWPLSSHWLLGYSIQLIHSYVNGIGNSRNQLKLSGGVV